jgi:hypothetical protein
MRQCCIKERNSEPANDPNRLDLSGRRVEVTDGRSDLRLPASYNAASLAVHMQIGIRRRLNDVCPQEGALSEEDPCRRFGP